MLSFSRFIFRKQTIRNSFSIQTREGKRKGSKRSWNDVWDGFVYLESFIEWKILSFDSALAETSAENAFPYQEVIRSAGEAKICINFGFFSILAGNSLVPTESIDDHCNKTVDIYVDVASPPVTYLNRHRPLTCWYRFKAIRGIPKDWVLRLTIKKFKVGTLVNATHCEGGYLQVSNWSCSL